MTIALLTILGQVAWSEERLPQVRASENVIKGNLVDAQTLKPITNAVISLVWKTKSKGSFFTGGDSARLRVKQGYVGAGGYDESMREPPDPNPSLR